MPDWNAAVSICIQHRGTKSDDEHRRNKRLEKYLKKYYVTA